MILKAAGGVPVPLDPLAARPRLGPAEAVRLARSVWGLEAKARSLPGERDRNYELRTPTGDRFVLKATSGAEGEDRLDLQERIVARIGRNDPGLRIPTPLPTLAGALRLAEGDGADRRFVRVFPFVAGVPLSSFRRRPPSLLAAGGRFLGRLSRALGAFAPSRGDEAVIPWNPAYAPELIERAGRRMADAERTDLYRRVGGFAQEGLPELLSLPAGMIHNDANDDNFLLRGADPETAQPEDLALLDFGDAVRAPRIIEAATGALYLGAGAAEPLRAALRVLRGFVAEQPIGEEEARLFPTALATRALVSAGIAALRRAGVPQAGDDAYLMTSEAAVWRVLAAFAERRPAVFRAQARAAGGHAPVAEPDRVRERLLEAARHARTPIPVGREPRFLDQTPASRTVDPRRRAALTEAVGELFNAGHVAIGRAREPRLASPVRRACSRAPEGEPETITLGLQIFAPAGAAVAATLDGAVAWAEGEDDGGGRIGIRHEAGGQSFWTVYRGLSHRDASGWAPGASVTRGQRIGRLADREPRDGPPRLEFQVLVRDLGPRPPARSAPRDLEVLAALSPDPSPLCGLDARSVCPEDALGDIPRLLKERARHISGALSLSYRRPIQTVRGHGAILYDAAGRDYLDMVNNVCHVGHAHPRVVAAIARQAALLNTNTRYLYDRLTEYAAALADLLPPPLTKVFFTNSGSEANDLALRIARARLGRRETIVLDGGYSGNLTSLVEISPYKLDGPGGRPAPRWLTRLPMPDGYRGRFRADRTAFPEELIADARERIRQRGPATFLGEAILSCGGQILPPPGYLQAVYRSVRAAGGVVIADEVQTGFGRTGPAFWAFLAVQGEHPEVPDIVTLGKPAGNGHPLAAVVTTPELARSFEGGMEYFNTYGGNPVSCVAGLAVLEVLREERLPEHAASVGEHLLAGLAELQSRHPIIGDVRGRGLFLGFEMVRDRETREPATAEAKRLANRMRDFRILNSTDGPDANVIKIKPPLPFSHADADRFLHTLDFALAEQF